MRWKYYDEKVQNAIKPLKAGASFNLGSFRKTSDEGQSRLSLKEGAVMGWLSLTLSLTKPLIFLSGPHSGL